MTEVLSVRLDSGTKRRLDALSKRSRVSKSFLAAKAIAAYVETEEWQLGEVQAGIDDLDSGKAVSHEKVSEWLKTWGKRGEIKRRDEGHMVSPRDCHLAQLREYIAKDSEGMPPGLQLEFSKQSTCLRSILTSDDLVT